MPHHLWIVLGLAKARSAPVPVWALALRAVVLTLLSGAAVWASVSSGTAASHAQALPPTLSATGLYNSQPHRQLAAGVLRFSPQYPLWSDAAEKERFAALPPGAAIDASDPDAWVFPRGSRFWKTFSHGGWPVETRYIELAHDGRWRYATYVWRADGSEADLAGAAGALLAVRDAPAGRYVVPAREDCLACHAGATVPVLGFGALQLSSQRDPLAAHGLPPGAHEVDLRLLAERGLVHGLPPRLLHEPPRIAARTPVERAALGYLQGNCAHCHHGGSGRVPVRLNLMQRTADAPAAAAAAVLRTLVEAPSRFQPDADREAPIVRPGAPAHSVLARRMASRDARVQMPPLGTEHIDSVGLALVERWIERELPQPATTQEP